MNLSTTGPISYLKFLHKNLNQLTDELNLTAFPE